MPHPPNFYEETDEPMPPRYEEDWQVFGVGDALSGVYTCPECCGSQRRTDPNRGPCAYCGGQAFVFAGSAVAAERDHAAYVSTVQRSPQSGGPGGSSAGSKHASGGSRHASGGSKHASGGSKRSSGGKPRPASSNKQ